MYNNLDTMASQAMWQPIETAPKDRDIYVCGLVKLWADSRPLAWQGEAAWDEESEGWITGRYDDFGDFLFVEATHWMESKVVEYPEVLPKKQTHSLTRITGGRQ